jgi:Tol biopolymer transport system component
VIVADRRARRDGTHPAVADTVPSGGLPPDSSESVEDIASADTMFAPASQAPLPPVVPGEVLGGRYRIVSEVGRGGEGVVYRALDMRADTVVALKLLERDATRLGRYRRELQMARKVTHPNAVRIHDIVDLPGRFGLSMELVEGEPLDARIARAGPLAAAELVSLARDLASALAAAHAAGVTHRDLKPANVILRAGGGGAVVTDFGISRLHGGPDAASSSQAPHPSGQMRLTAEGALIGTPLYMAPEQLEGRTDIGPPADVYAFGLVVREAATGQRLHVGATRLGELRAARRDAPPPPLSQERPDVPPAFAAVIDRCLAFESRDRFADGRALVEALGPARASLRAPARATQKPWGVPLTVVVAAVAAVVAAGVLPRVLGAHSDRSAPSPSAVAPPLPPSVALHASNVHRLTFGEGCQQFPTFGPDGDLVAYDVTMGKDDLVYTMRLSDGATHAVTHVDGWDVAPALSPDGRRIAFVRMSAKEEGAFVVDVEGATAPRRIAGGQTRPAWSRDGSAIWAGERARPRLYDVETGAVRDEIDAPAGALVARVLPAGNGVLALFPDDREPGSQGLALHVAGSPLQWLMHDDFEEAVALTPDGKSVLVSRNLVTRGMELVALPLSGGPPVSLATSGIEARKGIDVSRDGKRIVWSTCASRGGVTRLDRGKLDPLPGTGDWEDLGVAPIPGAESLVVLSTRGGPLQPWIVDRTQRQMPRRLELAGTGMEDVDVSPDGAWLVVQAEEGIEIAPLDGSAPARMLTPGGHDFAPRFTRDGREVLFTRRMDDLHTAVMAVSVDGGEPRVVLAHGARWAAPARVDDTIGYLAGDQTHALVPRIFDPRTGKDAPVSTQLAPGAYMVLARSGDGRRMAVGVGDQRVIELDATTGATLRTFESGDEIAHLVYVGRDLYVMRYAWSGGLWLADATWE